MWPWIYRNSVSFLFPKHFHYQSSCHNVFKKKKKKTGVSCQNIIFGDGTFEFLCVYEHEITEHSESCIKWPRKYWTTERKQGTHHTVYTVCFMEGMWFVIWWHILFIQLQYSLLKHLSIPFALCLRHKWYQFMFGTMQKLKITQKSACVSQIGHLKSLCIESVLTDLWGFWRVQSHINCLHNRHN